MSHKETAPEEFEGSGLPAPEDLSQAEMSELEEARRRRLDPSNRPDNAEVDNTHRVFDPVRGQFEDSPPDSSIGPYKV